MSLCKVIVIYTILYCIYFSKLHNNICNLWPLLTIFDSSGESFHNPSRYMYRFVHSRSDKTILGPPQCLRNGVLLENAMQRTGFMYGYYLEESWDGCQWHGCEISNIHSPSACFSWMISNWWPTIKRPQLHWLEKVVWYGILPKHP